MARNFTRENRPMYGNMPTHSIRGTTGMVGPIPMTGAEGGGAMQWASDNKWYLIGAGLLAAAAITYYTTRDHGYGHDF